MEKIAAYQQRVNNVLEKLYLDKQPENLYAPIRYILNIGGKRLRPALTLWSCDLWDSKTEDALHAALAVEVFHNFSLVHDDIMDAAPLRRGQQTVHKKWNTNTGILSGDAMLILAYKLLETYPLEKMGLLTKILSHTALEVCEGQQLDIDFETKAQVTLPEYIQMITYKTAVLVGAAMQMGAVVAGASNAQAKHLYNYGKYLGIAFQLQDDYLDVFGNAATFGKQVAGDIISNKKTYLYLHAQTYASKHDSEILEQMYSEKPSNPDKKIKTVTQIFLNSGAVEAVQKAKAHYNKLAQEQVLALSISESRKTSLHNFAKTLLARQV